jgi:predicted Zn finger-like uncharacterized protein
MLIVCPSCASEYTIDPAKLGADGRTVRCAICRDTWFATLDGSPAPAAEVEEPFGTGIEAPLPASPDKVRSWNRPRALAIACLAALAVLGWTQRSALSPDRWAAYGHSVLSDLTSRPTSSLEFRDVTSELTNQGEERVLLVEGEIVNIAQRDVTVPPLAIVVRNGDEQTLAAWTDAPPRTTLGPGEAVRFATRLASPPPDGRDVRVHFSHLTGVAIAHR